MKHNFGILANPCNPYVGNFAPDKSCKVLTRYIQYPGTKAQTGIRGSATKARSLPQLARRWLLNWKRLTIKVDRDKKKDAKQTL